MPFGYISRKQHDAKVKELYGEIARTGLDLTATKNDLAVARRNIGHAEAERDAANARCEWLEHDRDALRPDAERYRAQKAKRSLNLIPGGKPRKPSNGASAQAVV